MILARLYQRFLQGFLRLHGFVGVFIGVETGSGVKLSRWCCFQGKSTRRGCIAVLSGVRGGGGATTRLVSEVAVVLAVLRALWNSSSNNDRAIVVAPSNITLCIPINSSFLHDWHDDGCDDG